MLQQVAWMELAESGAFHPVFRYASYGLHDFNCVDGVTWCHIGGIARAIRHDQDAPT